MHTSQTAVSEPGAVMHDLDGTYSMQLRYVSHEDNAQLTLHPLL